MQIRIQTIIQNYAYKFKLFKIKNCSKEFLLFKYDNNFISLFVCYKIIITILYSNLK